MRSYERKMSRGVATCGALWAALCVGGCAAPPPSEPAVVSSSDDPAVERTVRGAHEDVANASETYVDERGLLVDGLGIDFPARLYPAADGFPTGPELGERLPEFTLPNQDGEPIDFHADRGDQQAVVVFYRSAVW